MQKCLFFEFILKKNVCEGFDRLRQVSFCNWSCLGDRIESLRYGHGKIRFRSDKSSELAKIVENIGFDVGIPLESRL